MPTTPTRATLIEALRDWLLRDSTTLTDTRAEDLIGLAEADIFDRLRIAAMERAVTLTVTGQSVPLPEDFLEMRSLLLPADGGAVEVAGMPSAAFWGRYPTAVTGRPAHFVIEANNIIFGPAPVTSYAMRMLYIARPVGVAAGNNALLAVVPDLYLYGTLAHSAAFIQDDERLPLWRGAYEAALERANAADQRRRLGATPLQIRAG